MVRHPEWAASKYVPLCIVSYTSLIHVPLMPMPITANLQRRLGCICDRSDEGGRGAKDVLAMGKTPQEAVTFCPQPPASDRGKINKLCTSVVRSLELHHVISAAGRVCERASLKFRVYVDEQHMNRSPDRWVWPRKARKRN
jgi:hypothetical protein